MKVHSVAITAKDLAAFIKSDYRGFDSKDYEFVAALVIARLHMKKFGGKYRMAFPLKYEETKREVGKEKDVVTEEIAHLLRESLEEDTPIDFSIISEDDINKGIHKGVAFQVKRVHPVPEHDYAEVISGRLNSLKNQYASVQATFLMVLGGREEGVPSLDLAKVKKLFDPEGFPFQNVMFMVMKTDSFAIGEIWPNYGRDEYSIDEWFEGDEQFTS